MRRRAARLLRTLGVAPTDGVSDIVDALARHIGAPIEVQEYLFPVPGFFGFTVQGTGGHVIFIQAATTPEHQAHLVLHEVAHIILGSLSPADDDYFTHRTGDYSNHEERDAEFLARVISTWIGAASDAKLAPQSDERSARLARVLEDRIAWS